MCTTCGCETSNNIEITKPGESPIKIDSIHANTHHHHGEGHSHNHEHHSHGTEEHAHSHHSNVIQLEQDILGMNNRLAERNRGYFEAKNISSLNLVSSPGSGKTAILVRTLTDLKDKISFSVIEGDQQTLQDANRISETKCPVIQINTGQACHLDSDMINKAVKELNPIDNSILFIENVGNLVCPALFDLGEDSRVVVISVTEGDDKPLKYPDMFASANLCLINKIDLLPYVDFDMEKVKENALRVNHHLEFIDVSAKTGEGMDIWYKYLETLLIK